MRSCLSEEAVARFLTLVVAGILFLALIEFFFCPC
jgi:hypothetical protein